MAMIGYDVLLPVAKCGNSNYTFTFVPRGGKTHPAGQGLQVAKGRRMSIAAFCLHTRRPETIANMTPLRCGKLDWGSLAPRSISIHFDRVRHPAFVPSFRDPRISNQASTSNASPRCCSHWMY